MTMALNLATRSHDGSPQDAPRIRTDEVKSRGRITQLQHKDTPGEKALESMHLDRRRLRAVRPNSGTASWCAPL